MKRVTSTVLFALVLLAFGICAHSTTLIQWNFNDQNIQADAGVYSSYAFGLVNGVTTAPSGAFASQVGSSDPSATGSSYNTSGYPATGVDNKSAGIEVDVSTVGYSNIIVSWDTKKSGTASKYVRFQYTTDWTTWIDGDLFSTSDQWVNGQTMDLSGISAVSNNANFAFRLVTEFAPGSSAYAAALDGSTYAGTGTIRYDMITVNATAVPEPGSLLAISAGLVSLIAYTTKRRR